MAIKRNHILISINLSIFKIIIESNKIGNKGAMAIGESLIKNHTLNTIELSNLLIYYR